MTSPNYQRLMEHGDARSIGDVLIAGRESAMEKQRLRSFASAGLTDLNAWVVAIGKDRDELKASADRTRAFLGSVAARCAWWRADPDRESRRPAATVLAGRNHPTDLCSRTGEDARLKTNCHICSEARSPSRGSGVPLIVGV